MQKALIVYDGNHPSLAELNKYLEEGWVVVIANSMSGANSGQSVSLVIIENKLLK